MYVLTCMFRNMAMHPCMGAWPGAWPCCILLLSKMTPLESRHLYEPMRVKSRLCIHTYVMLLLIGLSEFLDCGGTVTVSHTLILECVYL